MSRPPKYDELHLQNVATLINDQGLLKKDAIVEAGFSDTSQYYHTLRRLQKKEKITIVPNPKISYNKVSFI